MAMDYALVQRIIDGTGRILDTKPSNPDEGTWVTEAQLRDWIRNCTVVKGYYYASKFYSDISHTAQIVPDTSSLYIDLHTGQGLYRWDGAAYVSLTNQIGRYRGDVNELPDYPANGDWFFASETFTEDGTTYLANNMYFYNGSTWDDLSGLFSQFARQMQVDEIQSDLDDVEDEIDQLQQDVSELQSIAGSGYRYKGDCTYAQLPSSGQQLGDMWYVTDMGREYVWNGTTWRPIPRVGMAWVDQGDGTYKIGILEM